MKKTSFYEILTCVLFCGFIGIMGLGYLLLPKGEFSDLEKRNLEESPELTWEQVVSGEFGTNLEDYMADHMPGRNFFVGLGAYYDLLMGQQATKDVYRAEGNRLVEKPVIWDQAQAEKNIKYINKLAEKLEVPVDLILVPSAGFILEDSIQGIHDAYTDDIIIDAVYAMANKETVRCLDLTGLYRNVRNPGDLYYRTDHHWTSYGAYLAYQSYMQCLGREYLAKDGFTIVNHSGFRGSTYSRSGLWLTPAEDISLWYGSALTVTTDNSTHEGAFYLEQLQASDMYTVFLGGNQPIVRITNPANAGKGKLLVIRDSYSNCIGAMLAESYEEVIMVDLRYYHNSVSNIITTEGIDNVLVMYSIGNFMTDDNFPFLR